ALSARVEPGELLARLGGDEFALLIDELPDGQDALAYATERAHGLAGALTAPVEIAGVALSVEACIGVVAVPAGGCVMAELLRRADVAMYQAKRSGRPIVRYEPGRDAASTDRLALLAEFRDALAVDDQLILQLQPAVNLATGGPTGVEALVRWQHPRRGLLGPGEFVGVVEQSELVGPFTRYVLDVALGVMASWAAEGLDVPIAVNMSARSLLDRRLPGDVAELLGRHHVSPDRLVLEITETVMMTELEIIDDVLAGLRAIGVRLSVDDFGTGYSSLTFLARFAVDEVKVDQAFVAKMGDSPEAAAIVRSTVELGRALGLRVIAEGVETAEQKAALAAMGCEAGQGYHFFAPMDPAKTSKVLWTLQRAAEARGARVIPLTGRTAQPGHAE
ncbi:MAG: bifunctional diguanylate cyclase/phosphodiesterase, partial [Actinocatenispora sp.]